MKGANSSAVIGGVARDSSRWLWGFSGRIGNSNVDSVELIAVKKGLELAWERRVHGIIIETNSANVFKWLNSGVGNCHLLHDEIEACKWLIHRP